LSAHRGKVEEWRVFRTQAWAIALSSGNYKNPPKPEELLPLPYDEESGDEELSSEDLLEFYNNAIREYNGG
jgi:hypothetical protein